MSALIIEQALASARALARGQAKRSGTLTDPRGNVIAFVPAAERVRVGRDVLPQVGLMLRARDEQIVDGALVQRWRLTAMSGDTDEWSSVMPLDRSVPPDLAVAWARTHALSAAIKGLLWPDEEDVAPEPTQAPAPAPPKQREEDSDGGPVRTELLPPGYRANTRVWTMSEIRAEVEKETRSREGCACTTGTVYIDDACYYRARWSTARKTPWGSVSWLAWRTSTLEPAEFSCRRWTKVSGDWPAHPDDPKPEQDSRPMTDIMGGETLPDISPLVRVPGPLASGSVGAVANPVTVISAASSPGDPPDHKATPDGQRIADGALSTDSSTATTGTPIHDLPPAGCPSIESTPAVDVTVGTNNKPQRDASTDEALVANDPVKPNPLGLSDTSGGHPVTRGADVQGPGGASTLSAPPVAPPEGAPSSSGGPPTDDDLLALHVGQRLTIRRTNGELQECVVRQVNPYLDRETLKVISALLVEVKFPDGQKRGGREASRWCTAGDIISISRNGVSSGLPSPVEPPKGSAHPPDPSPVEPAGDVPLVVDVPGGAAPTLTEALAARGLTHRPSTVIAVAGRHDVMRGEVPVISGATASDVWAWLHQGAPDKCDACDCAPCDCEDDAPLIEPSSEALAALYGVIARRKAAAAIDAALTEPGEPTREQFAKAFDAIRRDARPGGGSLTMTYADGSTATIPVPPAAAKRMENRIASGDSGEALKFRASKWKFRQPRKATRDAGVCVECGEAIEKGATYHEGVKRTSDSAPAALLSKRGVPFGRAHALCVEDLAEGLDPRATSAKGA